MKILYPGSFNPWHAGHQFVYEQACQMVGQDNVFVGLAKNPDKNVVNPEWIKWTPAPITRNVLIVEGATVDACVDMGFEWIIRGVRPSYDLPQEASMDWWNRKLSSDRVRTFFVFTPQGYDHVSSSSIKVALNLGHPEAIEGLVNKYVLARWLSPKKEVPFSKVYFGRSCVGKTTYFKSHGIPAVNCDEAIWDGINETFKTIIQGRLREAIRNRDRREFDVCVTRIAGRVNWHKLLLCNAPYLDAAAIGVYFDHIPQDILSQFQYVRMIASDEIRHQRAQLKGFEDKLEGFDWAYRDPPFWDEELNLG